MSPPVAHGASRPSSATTAARRNRASSSSPTPGWCSKPRPCPAASWSATADRRDRHRRRGAAAAPRTAAATSSPPAWSSSTPTTSSATSSRAPGVRLARGAAILAHDAELAGAGITTVFDALRVGSLVAAARSATRTTPGRSPPRSGGCATPARCASATCCTCAPRSAPRPSRRSSPSSAQDDRVGIVSLMDHTPGQRQFTDIDKLRDYAIGRRGMTEAEFQAHVARMRDLQARHGPATRPRPSPRRAGSAPRSPATTTPPRRRSPPPPATASASPSSRPRWRPPRPAAPPASRSIDGGAQPGPRRLALRQRRRRGRWPRPACSTSSPPTTCPRACSPAPSASASRRATSPRASPPSPPPRPAPPASPTAAASRRGLAADLLRFRLQDGSSPPRAAWVVGPPRRLRCRRTRPLPTFGASYSRIRALWTGFHAARHAHSSAPADLFRPRGPPAPGRRLAHPPGGRFATHPRGALCGWLPAWTATLLAPPVGCSCSLTNYAHLANHASMPLTGRGLRPRRVSSVEPTAEYKLGRSFVVRVRTPVATHANSR